MDNAFKLLIGVTCLAVLAFVGVDLWSRYDAAEKTASAASSATQARLAEQLAPQCRLARLHLEKIRSGLIAIADKPAAMAEVADKCRLEASD